MGRSPIRSAWAFYRLGQYDKAVEWLERAIEQKGDDATIIEHLGDAYWHVGRQRRGALPMGTGAQPEGPTRTACPVIKDKIANGPECGQRQADRLPKKGRRHQAGRLSRHRWRALRCGLPHAQGQSLAERRRPQGVTATTCSTPLVAFVDPRRHARRTALRSPVARNSPGRRAAGPHGRSG